MLMNEQSTKVQKMLDITPSTADTFYSWSSLVVIVAGVVGALAAAISLWSGSIRERFADERTSRNEAETQTAKAQAATANAEAASAQLELEKLRGQVAWRSIDANAAMKIAQRLASRPATVTIVHVAGDPESLAYAIQLSKLFEAAKWRMSWQSRTLADAIYFGLTIPAPENESTKLIRAALAEGGIEANSDPLPPAVMQIGSIGGNAVLFVGTKPTAVLRLRQQ